MSYVLRADGTLQLVSTMRGAHEVVPVWDLSAGARASVLDSPQALQDAAAAGGAAFTQRTGVQLWSMQLTGRDNRLVWIVQYGAPVPTQRQRMTFELDAASGDVISQARSD